MGVGGLAEILAFQLCKFCKKKKSVSKRNESPKAFNIIILKYNAPSKRMGIIFCVLFQGLPCMYQ